MRKITEDAAGAFHAGKEFKRGNTVVRVGTNEVAMFLHGNKIAMLQDGVLYISSAGYETNNTKERLNGLNGVEIQQKNRNWYLNGRRWLESSEWTNVEEYTMAKYINFNLETLW